MIKRRKRRITFLPTVAAAGSSGAFTPPPIWYAPDASFDGCVIGAYQSIGVPGYAESLWNLANVGTYDLTAGVAPAWSPTHGWQFNASWGSYLKTGIIPTQAYSYVVRFTGHDTTAINSVFGMYGATNAAEIDLWCAVPGTGMIWWFGGSIDNIRPPLVDHGVFGLAADQPYRNSLPDGLPFGITWTEPAVEIYLGAINMNGVPVFQDTVNIQAFAAYSCTLSADQMAAVMDGIAML